MITCEEMKQIDAYAIEVLKVPSIVLMENAAISFVNALDFKSFQKVGVICGVGNNGGDGLAIGRQLLIMGIEVEFFIIGDTDKATTDFAINYEILQKLDAKFKNFSNEFEFARDRDIFSDCDLLVDAIFGIGLSRTVNGFFYEVIEYINSLEKPIYSVDIPSGLSGDTGLPMGTSIIAHETVTFHKMKIGLVNALEFTGTLHIGHIGIPNYINIKKRA